ncbi:Ubiquitin carboxyl-terminal hydrolase 21 [Acorus gramineus]|uniref:Ubiquitin carboxyl-terminal hydrolase 21 n=1 Tax=Acorus gramineus TaxID=55184 RepID=A0AAV9B9A6_ACOGR|nr:Ubiquitin carboxyl-terminal hydrolase 21 [Acorus gramineus]
MDFNPRLIHLQVLFSGCGYVSATPEPLHSLSLAIDKSDSLLDALKFFMIVERLEGLTCDECKMTVAKEKGYTFDQAPLVVFFHLKRFSIESNDIQKMDKFVEFPLELNWQPFHGGTQENKMLYNLYAVMVHIGSCGSGHYISYVHPSPGSWYQLNDSEVSQVSEGVVLKQNAYLRFYIRQNSPWFSSYMEKLEKESSSGGPGPIIENAKNVCAIPRSAKQKMDAEQIINEFLSNVNNGPEGFNLKEESSTSALHKNYPGIDSFSVVPSSSMKAKTKVDNTAADAMSKIPFTPPPPPLTGSMVQMRHSEQSSGKIVSIISPIIFFFMFWLSI